MRRRRQGMKNLRSPSPEPPTVKPMVARAAKGNKVGKFVERAPLTPVLHREGNQVMHLMAALSSLLPAGAASVLVAGDRKASLACPIRAAITLVLRLPLKKFKSMAPCNAIVLTCPRAVAGAVGAGVSHFKESAAIHARLSRLRAFVLRRRVSAAPVDRTPSGEAWTRTKALPADRRWIYRNSLTASNTVDSGHALRIVPVASICKGGNHGSKLV